MLCQRVPRSRPLRAVQSPGQIMLTFCAEHTRSPRNLARLDLHTFVGTGPATHPLPFSGVRRAFKGLMSLR